MLLNRRNERNKSVVFVDSKPNRLPFLPKLLFECGWLHVKRTVVTTKESARRELALEA